MAFQRAPAESEPLDVEAEPTRERDVRRGPAAAPQPVYEVELRDGGVRIRRDEAGSLRSNVTT